MKLTFRDQRSIMNPMISYKCVLSHSKCFVLLIIYFGRGVGCNPVPPKPSPNKWICVKDSDCVLVPQGELCDCCLKYIAIHKDFSEPYTSYFARRSWKTCSHKMCVDRVCSRPHKAICQENICLVPQ